MTVARTVGRNTLFAAFARIAVLGVWFVATPHVLARLGTDAFGFWSILLVLGGSLATVDLGLGVAVTRFVARLATRGASGPMRSVLFRAALLQAGVALALAGAAFLATGAILHAFHVPAAWLDDARVALQLALGAFVITALGNLFVAGLQGLQRMDLVFRVAAPAALALGIGIFWGTAQPRPLVALTFVQLAYALVTALAYGLLLFGGVRGRGGAPGGAVAPEDAHVPLRELLVLGGWVQVNAILGLVQAHVDKILLGTLVALAPVASYELGARITLAAMLPPVLFLGALLPAFARDLPGGGDEPPLALYRAALAPHFAMSFGITGGLVALAPWILGAWLLEPPPLSVLCLVALAVAQGGHLVTGVSSTVARTRGGLRHEFTYAVLGTGLHVALALVGLRIAGVPGLLVGTMASSVVAAAWFVLRIESWLGSGVRGAALRQAAPFAAAAATAGGAAFVAAVLVNPERAGAGARFALAAGGLAYGAAFAAAIRFGSPPLWGTLVDRARRLRGGEA